MKKNTNQNKTAKLNNATKQKQKNVEKQEKTN